MKKKIQVPQFILEELAHGELRPEHQKWFHDLSEEEIHTVIEEIKQKDHQFHSKRNMEREIRKLHTLAKNKSEANQYKKNIQFMKWAMVGGALAVALVIFFINIPLYKIQQAAQSEHTTDSIYVAKGGIQENASSPPGSEQVFSNADQEPFGTQVPIGESIDAPDIVIYPYKKNTSPLEEQARLNQGDTIIVRYVPGKYKYGCIVSVDGNRYVTLHFPESQEHSTLLNNQATFLAQPFVLDDAPFFECFFFITSMEPIQVEQYLDAAKDWVTDAGDIIESRLPHDITIANNIVYKTRME